MKMFIKKQAPSSRCLDIQLPMYRFVESEPDVTRVQAVPDDEFIIMASDGLWDVIEDKDSVAIVKVGPGC